MRPFLTTLGRMAPVGVLAAGAALTTLVALAAVPPPVSAAGTWSLARASHGDERYMGVDFVSLLRGWAASGTDSTSVHTHAVATTSDGGTTWTNVLLQPHSAYPDLRDVAFFTSSTGVAVGMGTTVVRSTDGGATWQSVAAANSATLHADFYDVDVVSESRAYAAGYTYGGKGVDVVMTNDGGATWVDRSPAQLKDATGVRVHGLDFVDAQHGWALYQNASDELRVLSTTDGGLTWTQKLLVDDQWAFPRDLYFLDDRHGWALAGYYSYRLFRTTDGGATWTQVGTPTGSGQVWCLFFVTPTHGFMGTESTSMNPGVVWETVDGGTTWTAAHSGPAGWPGGIRALDFTDANHGWAAGHVNNTAVILKYVGTDPLPPDTTDPVSSVTGATNGAWYKRDVVLTFEAADGGFGSSGVAGITWYIDLFTFGFVPPGGKAYFLAPADHSKDGSYQVFYYAEDNAGNREGDVSAADKSITFGIDTRRPTTSAPYAASARRGTTAALKYKVKDVAPCGAKAKTVTVKVYRSGVLKKTLKYTNKAVNALHSARFTVPGTWATGTYLFKVYATDNAGNAQATVGSNKLVVK